MAEKVIRIRIEDDVLRRFKVLCVEMDLSIPQQTKKLIEQFIKVQSENFNNLRRLRRI